ncbi:hypothetical protein E4U55_006858 [Claviceps digitariae]|nr:hypothetical protein E4U55_006858 [Claviceps digitariae]
MAKDFMTSKTPPAKRTEYSVGRRPTPTPLANWNAKRPKRKNDQQDQAAGQVWERQMGQSVEWDEGGGVRSPDLGLGVGSNKGWGALGKERASRRSPIEEIQNSMAARYLQFVIASSGSNTRTQPDLESSHASVRYSSSSSAACCCWASASAGAELSAQPIQHRTPNLKRVARAICPSSVTKNSSLIDRRRRRDRRSRAHDGNVVIHS